MKVAVLILVLVISIGSSVVAAPFNSSSRQSSSEELQEQQSNDRQFVGFLNPEDQSIPNPPTSRSQTMQSQPRRRNRYRFLPDVLRDEEIEPEVLNRSGFMNTSDSATFAQPQVVSESPAMRTSPVPDYGATEMTPKHQRKQDL